MLKILGEARSIALLVFLCKRHKHSKKTRLAPVCGQIPLIFEEQKGKKGVTVQIIVFQLHVSSRTV